jgi:uncharacterized protein (TIGR03067 family)
MAITQTLEGRYEAVYQEADGQAAGPTKGVTTILELTKSGFSVEKSGKVEYEGTYATTWSATVASGSIALTYSKSAKPSFLGGPRPGIFQIDGDTLKVCFGPVNGTAPIAFNTINGSSDVLSVYQRASKGGTITPFRAPPTFIW